MERQKNYEDLINTGKGLKRYLKTCEYIPSGVNSEAERIINLCKKTTNLLEMAEREAESIKIKGYEDGFQKGKQEALNQYTSVINSLVEMAEKLKEKELTSIKSIMGYFLNNLARFISKKNHLFVEEYIMKMIEKADSKKIRIVVSENIYNLIAGSKSLPENIEILQDSSLSSEQIFIERDEVLSDAGIDRFFQEISQ